MKSTVRRMLYAAMTVTAVALAIPAEAGERLKVVASFTILADLAQEVGGRHVEVTSIVGPDQDVHRYTPDMAARDRLAGADLLIINGLGLEPWIDQLIRDARYPGPVVMASRGVPVLTRPSDTGSGATEVDPHAWQDMTNGRTYVANIAAALVKADPDNADDYRLEAAKYDRLLTKLDLSIRNRFYVIPIPKAKVITTHDAFQYFGRAYGVKFQTVQGLDTDRPVTMAHVDALTAQMKDAHVRAVFMENVSDPAVLDFLKDRADAIIGGTLYSDALSGQDGPAATYTDMFRHNVRELTKAVIW